MPLATTPFKEFVRHAYAWPGGYPLYAICDDGGALCHACAKANAKQVIRSTREHACDGWACTSVDVNWEDAELYCDHCSQHIECAYTD